MPKASPIQQSFNSGELSPLLQGRTDIANYKYGLKTCSNYRPLIQGPLTRRCGTVFVAEVKDSSKAVRVVRFEFSTEQAYILEFGDQYMRVYKDRSRVTAASQNITGATAANPVVITYTGADTYANGDRVFIASVGGMTQINNREFTVANVDVGANTFELSGVDGTGYDAYTSGGTVSEIYEIATPYLEADLFELDVRTQSADTLYIFHEDYEPRKLTRTGHTAWAFTIIDFLDGPYAPTNATTTTLTLSATTGSVTVTASAITGINGGAGFATTDVGRLIRWRDPALNWTWLEITAWTSTTVVTATIRGANASAGTATTAWRLGIWSETTGYPAAGTFYEDRLFAGGATDNPTRTDGSKSSDYENFAPTAANGTVADDNAFPITLNARSVNKIRWLVDDEKSLIIGTVGGPWSVQPSSNSAALSPTDRAARRAYAAQAAAVPPIEAGKSTLFVQRAGRKVLALSYNYLVDGYQATDATRLASHVTSSGIKDTAYEEEPFNTVWCARNDGKLLGLTYNEEDKVVAWHPHTIGGVFGSGNAVVESLAVVPSTISNEDETWMVVKRTISGQTKRYIEYMSPSFTDETAQDDAHFVDCGLVYDSTSATIIGGLWHLNGETVSILADGATHPDKVVTNGKVTLDRAASVVHFGYGYNSDGETMRWDAGAADGTSQGKDQRIYSLAIRFHRSLNLSIGPDFNTLTPIIFRDSNDTTGTMVPLFTGDKRGTFDGDVSLQSTVCWRQSDPLPSTIVALMPQILTEDRN